MRFTDSDKLNIVKLYNEGYSSHKIAKEYNSNSVTIRGILIRRGVKLRNNSQYRSFTLDFNYFNSVDTPEKAQIFGYLCADGYNCQKRNYVSIRMQSKDEDYLLEILNKIGSNQPIRTYIKNNKNASKQVGAAFYSKKFSNDLANLGCVQGKSLILDFPKNISNELLPHFLRGYFEGDGCICRYSTYKNRWGLSLCGTLNFCLEFGDILFKKFGITNNCHKNNSKKNAYVISFSGNENIKIICDWLYAFSPFVMNRKYQIYLDLCNFLKNKEKNASDEIFKRNNKIIIDFKNEESMDNLINNYKIKQNTIERIIRYKEFNNKL